MTYTYTWTDAEHTALKRECAEMGTCAFVPTDPGNRDYAEFLNSGQMAHPYQPPIPPTPPTPQEKLASLGLTIQDLKLLLN